MEKTENYKYLGFMISSKGNNMVNIREVKNKSIGVIRKIFTKMASLNLNQYYFECGVILLNSILRGTILYAADMYYNLKENEIRQIERIEEQFLRKLIKTTKGCPIKSLYLEIGQTPARFQIIKMRLLYLKYILEQPETSNIRKILEIQMKLPKPGDWVSTCLDDLKYLKLNITFEEIRKISKKRYSVILKEKITEIALNYLLDKRGSKGSEINYTFLEMSEFLLPFNNKLTISEKCELFAVRNRMIDIPSNFSSNCEAKCECGAIENMKHIYECKILNKNKKIGIPYENIYNGNLQQQIEVYRKFKENLIKRKQFKDETISNPCDSFVRCITVRDQ